MSVASVKKFFRENELNFEVIEMEESTATVELAAQTLGVEPALIAKTMAFELRDKYILILTQGDARIDNRKYKDYFKEKAKMLKPNDVLEVTGHPVGGVCPFGLKNPIDVYLDVSLQKFEHVYPAAGSKNSAVKITPEQLQEVTESKWIDVCKL
jgi:Cys-tRNA(Pro) deacylase